MLQIFVIFILTFLLVQGSVYIPPLSIIFTSKMASSNPHHCTRTIFYGPIINPVRLDCFNTLPHCLLCIDPSGKIEWMINNVYEHQLQETLASKGHSNVKFVCLKDGEFLMPGFIDTHTVTRCSLILQDLAWLSRGSTRLNFRSWERQSFSFQYHSCLKLFFESRGNQYKLLDWLNALVFPTESKFNDNNVEFVQKTYQSVVRRVLDFGVH